MHFGANGQPVGAPGALLACKKSSIKSVSGM